MIQILPHIPGFGERLADSLTGAGGNVASGFVQQMQNQNTQKIYEQLGDPNLSPMDKFKIAGGLPQKEREKFYEDTRRFAQEEKIVREMGAYEFKTHLK